jgi:hypothetical protein
MPPVPKSPVREDIAENSRPKLASPVPMDVDPHSMPVSPKKESLTMDMDAKSPAKSENSKSPSRPLSPSKATNVVAQKALADETIVNEQSRGPLEVETTEVPLKSGAPMKIGELLKLAKPTSQRESSPSKEIVKPVEGPVFSPKKVLEDESSHPVGSSLKMEAAEEKHHSIGDSRSPKRELSPKMKGRSMVTSLGNSAEKSLEPKALASSISEEKSIVSSSPKRDMKPTSPTRDIKSSPRPFPGSPLKSSTKKEEKPEKRKAMDETVSAKKSKTDHRFVSPQATKPIIQSLDVVKETIKNYVPMRSDTESSAEISDFETVDLEYPQSNQETFALVTPKREDYDPIIDIANTVRYIAFAVVPSHLTQLGDEHTGIVRAITKATNRRMIEELKTAVHDFNQVIKKYQSDGVFDEMESTGPRASRELIQHILEQSYARSIAPHSHLLNQYEGFSNNVYGEIKPAFVTEIIKHAEIEPSDIFLDLGSGIGNVVLQVAAECLCESYGIEIMETPASFAKKQRAEFVARMHSYAQPCGRIYLKQGDFLKDEPILNVIGKADVIFVNK